MWAPVCTQIRPRWRVPRRRRLRSCPTCTGSSTTRITPTSRFLLRAVLCTRTRQFLRFDATTSGVFVCYVACANQLSCCVVPPPLPSLLRVHHGRAMFASGMKESRESEVTLPDIRFAGALYPVRACQALTPLHWLQLPHFRQLDAVYLHGHGGRGTG